MSCAHIFRRGQSSVHLCPPPCVTHSRDPVPSRSRLLFPQNPFWTCSAAVSSDSELAPSVSIRLIPPGFPCWSRSKPVSLVEIHCSFVEHHAWTVLREALAAQFRGHCEHRLEPCFQRPTCGSRQADVVRAARLRLTCLRCDPVSWPGRHSCLPSRILASTGPFLWLFRDARLRPHSCNHRSVTWFGASWSVASHGQVPREPIDRSGVTVEPSMPAWSTQAWHRVRGHQFHNVSHECACSRASRQCRVGEPRSCSLSCSWVWSFSSSVHPFDPPCKKVSSSVPFLIRHSSRSRCPLREAQSCWKACSPAPTLRNLLCHFGRGPRRTAAEHVSLPTVVQ